MFFSFLFYEILKIGAKIFYKMCATTLDEKKTDRILPQEQKKPLPKKNTKKLRKSRKQRWKSVFFWARGGLQTEGSNPHFFTRFLRPTCYKKYTFYTRRLTYLLYTRRVFGTFGPLWIVLGLFGSFWPVLSSLLDRFEWFFGRFLIVFFTFWLFA